VDWFGVDLTRLEGVSMITFKINDKEVVAEEGQTILEVAREHKIEIPTLCYHQALSPAGACRLCTVEVYDGRRTRLVTSCNYPVWRGMEVQTHTERVLHGRRMIVELLLARCPNVKVIQDLAREYGIEQPRFPQETDDCILCGLCTRMCEERMGVSAISLTGRGVDLEVDTPFHLHAEVCRTCGACASVCPTGHIKLEDISTKEPKTIPSEFNRGVGPRKPINIPFPQATPNVPVIDSKTCVHLNTGACQVCQEFCGPGAINFNQKDEILEIDAGAVILATGYEVFDARKKPEYGYGRYPNVITSIEYERILSAGGPFKGHIQRPSDGTEPKRVAWIQCVGSRDASIGCDYCSYVCCMYATKQAMISKEHDREVEPTIFYIDMRAPGKGFERYYNRARTTGGVRYVRSMISRVLENPQTHDLDLTYVDESGEIQTEEFDMVILSVGLRPDPAFLKLADELGLKLNQFGFCESQPLDTVSTSIPGIYACGAIQSPKDIPISVLDGSSAAGAATSFLAEARGTLVEEQVYPEERSVTAEEPRIGVFLCDCGINIAGTIAVNEVTEYTKTLPHVVFAEEYLFTCSTDTQEEMKGVIEKHRLNRVVVASCSPRTHEPLFQDTIREAGLNKYLFEMANVRDQSSWVHTYEPERATAKAKDLVRMAVARSALLEPLHDLPFDVVQKGLVIGGGLAGLTAAYTLAQQGFETYLVEKTDQLGGNARTLYYTEDGARPAEYVEKLINDVEGHPLITVHMQAEVKNYSGHLGKFTSTISMIGTTQEVEYGAVIVATGGAEHQPSEYLHGQSDRVVTQKELERRISLEPETLEEIQNLVMIQCVGCMDEEHPYCSRICCTSAVKNSLKLKALNPDMNIYVLYRDMRTFGLKELAYKQAREKGVRFLRFFMREKPDVSEFEGRLVVRVRDQNLTGDVTLEPDLLVLSAAVRPHPGTKQVADVFKLPADPDGFLSEAHVKLRPVDFANAGIFMCGLVHMPKFADETIAQAKAAASRACSILAQEQMYVGGTVASVDRSKCAICLTCVRTCPYNVPRVDEAEGVIIIDPAACQGCGNCATACPRNAITVGHSTDEQFVAKICALY
jgi:heterodisulfide reductase subunit A